MPDTDTHLHPSTVAPLQLADQGISQLADQAKDITTLLLAAYGPEDRRTIRAQEIRDAIQRLQWAMERAKTMTA